MPTICSYLNPCSRDFNTVENFKSLSCGQKTCIGLITALTTSTLIFTPIAVPIFRLLVERCTPIYDLVTKQEPSHRQTLDFQIDKALGKEGTSCYVNYELRKKIDSTREKELLRTILSCKETRALYQKAVATSYSSHRFDAGTPWIFDFAYLDTIYARCELSERRITLHSDLPFDRALAQAIFELTNATSAPAHAKIDRNMSAYSCEEYIRAIEYIEWKGLIEHHRIIQLCVKNHGWSEALDISKDLASMPFEDYWNYIKKTAHYKMYEEIYTKTTFESICV